jgi:hypothetical protein
MSVIDGDAVRAEFIEVSVWLAWHPTVELLVTGASVRGVTFPSGYGEVDELLKAHGAG